MIKVNCYKDTGKWYASFEIPSIPPEKSCMMGPLDFYIYIEEQQTDLMGVSGFYMTIEELDVNDKQGFCHRLIFPNGDAK